MTDEGITMKKTIAAAAVAATGLFAFVGTGIADKRTISDAEGDVAGPPHHDFVSGTQGHQGKKAVVHTATVAGKADVKDFPTLEINTKGDRASGPEYVVNVAEDGSAVVQNVATGATKPALAYVGADELINTYKLVFRKGAIGSPERKYGWRFVIPGEDVMPNDGYAIHRLRK
jgi:hypothetical protein